MGPCVITSSLAGMDWLTFRVRRSREGGTGVSLPHRTWSIEDAAPAFAGTADDPHYLPLLIAVQARTRWRWMSSGSEVGSTSFARTSGGGYTPGSAAISASTSAVASLFSASK